MKFVLRINDFHLNQLGAQILAVFFPPNIKGLTMLVVMCLSCSFVSPWLCRLGRSKTLLISLTLSVVFGVLVCVSPYPSIFIVMRFCLAAASAGVYLTLYIARKYTQLYTYDPRNMPDRHFYKANNPVGLSIIFFFDSLTAAGGFSL